MHKLKNLVRLMSPLAQFRSSLAGSTRSSSYGARHKSTRFKAESVEHDNKARNIELTWDNKHISKYPYVFLRDNCPCPNCYHPTSGQRLVLIQDALKDANDGIKSAKLQEDAIHLKWSCGHESVFDAKWMEERGFVEKDADEKCLHPVRGFQNVLWDAGHAMKFVDFEDFMTKDEVLYEWMKTILTEGIAVLRNAPLKPNQLKVVAARSSGRVVHTMYGDIFTVKDKPGASNVAYTSGYLAMHTDQPYNYYQPGIQALHCINPSVDNEGVNELVDGFKVAHDFKLQHPDHFEVLSTLTFPYEQDGNEMYGEFQLYADQSIIGLDQHGEVERISHNNPSRGSFMNHSPDETKKLYAALECFVSLMYEKKYLVKHHLKAGDIICFNNRRVLHGRTPYNPSSTNRWLEGTYFSWDDFCAKIRPLKYRFEP